MPNEQKPHKRRRQPTRDRIVRTLGPATVRITQTGKLKVMHDDPALDRQLRFDPPQGQIPE